MNAPNKNANPTNARSEKRRFHGIIPPIITPLQDHDTLDELALSRLIEHTINGGVHGLFVLGTTGEAANLSYRLRCEVVGKVCELVDGRIPVLAGISDTSLADSLNMAEVAADAGADAVVLTSPYYYPLTQAELLQYVESVVSEVALPLMLYNMPGLTDVWFDLDTLASLSGHSNIVGIKDSSGDMDYFRSLKSLRYQRPDWSILIGPEHQLLEAMAMGGDGGVNGGANVLPEIFTRCYEAAAAGDSHQANRMLKLIQQFQGIYDINADASRHVRATKCAASLVGICQNITSAPFQPCDEAQTEMIQNVLNLVNAGFQSVTA